MIPAFILAFIYAGISIQKEEPFSAAAFIFIGSICAAISITRK